MHPVANIRGSASSLLAGRRIVLAVSGSIAAVKCVELARELARHGADVHAVMSSAAAGIVHPDALHFATGNPVVTRLTGEVEHVQLLGDVPEKADLLLVAPATANTVTKMALGIDDTPVTTCATVAFGTRTPVVVAPAMHEAMLDHPIVGKHARTLIEDLGVTWVEPEHDEKKAKLADVVAITDAVIRRLATGPYVGKRVLVVGGATAEPVDPMRVLTNRSSGRTAVILAHELHRLGAHVTFWYGQGTATLPVALADCTRRFASHADLMAMVQGVGQLDAGRSTASPSDDLRPQQAAGPGPADGPGRGGDGPGREAHGADPETDAPSREADAARGPDGGFDQVWMPAAINDYAPVPSSHKVASEQDGLSIPLRPLGKVIEALSKRLPDAVLVAFKAESDAAGLVQRARERMARYGASWVVANTDAAFDAPHTEAWLLGADGTEQRLEGDKLDVMRQIIARVAGAGHLQVTA